MCESERERERAREREGKRVYSLKFPVVVLFVSMVTGMVVFRGR